MKEFMQFIRATADLARHKVGAFLRSHDPDLANVTSKGEPTFEELEATLEHLAMVPEDTDNSRVVEWVTHEFDGLEPWQLKLVLMWYGDQIINGRDGGNYMVSIVGQDQIVVRSLGCKR